MFNLKNIKSIEFTRVGTIPSEPIKTNITLGANARYIHIDNTKIQDTIINQVLSVNLA